MNFFEQLVNSGRQAIDGITNPHGGIADRMSGAMSDAQRRQSEADARRAAARQRIAGMTAPTNPYQGGGQAVGGQQYSQYLQNLNKYNTEMATQQHLAGNMTDDQLNRSRGINAGEARGIQNFIADPDMMATRDRLGDLSKGYSGSEMGAMRQLARGEIAGQRSGYMRQLASKSARAGVGGARAAAMQGAADQGFARQGADAERKMALDNAQLVRSGTKDLSDFLMRQRFGILASGLGEAGLSSADATRNAMLGQY